MAANYQIYFVDCETTGLSTEHSPVEISIFRLADGVQKTWYPKPINSSIISIDALRVNGLKAEDLRGETKEGREKYQEPKKVLVEIENWLMEDFTAPEDRILAGQHISFDKMMLEELWRKCGSYETFPFNHKFIIDTFLIEFFMDYCKGKFAEGYNLGSLTKKYGVHNEKAHSAEFDTKAAVEVFQKQVDVFRKLLNK
jgi:DNA polymerase III epsilon subunit-like protein